MVPLALTEEQFEIDASLCMLYTKLKG